LESALPSNHSQNKTNLSHDKKVFGVRGTLKKGVSPLSKTSFDLPSSVVPAVKT
jgi:hypothetical protein